MAVLVEDKKSVVKSYSFMLSASASVIGFVDVVLPYLGFFESFMSPTAYGFVAFGLSFATVVAKFIKQDLADGKLDGKLVTDKE